MADQSRSQQTIAGFEWTAENGKCKRFYENSGTVSRACSFFQYSWRLQLQIGPILAGGHTQPLNGAIVGSLQKPTLSLREGRMQLLFS